MSDTELETCDICGKLFHPLSGVHHIDGSDLCAKEPIAPAAQDGLPLLGFEPNETDVFQVVDMRETQLKAALARIAELEKELTHWEDKPFYTRDLFHQTGEMDGKDFSAVTDEQFKTLFEYSDSCKCQPCAEIRHILQLRARIAELEAIVVAEDSLDIFRNKAQKAEAALAQAQKRISELEREPK